MLEATRHPLSVGCSNGGKKNQKKVYFFLRLCRHAEQDFGRAAAENWNALSRANQSLCAALKRLTDLHLKDGAAYETAVKRCAKLPHTEVSLSYSHRFIYVFNLVGSSFSGAPLTRIRPKKWRRP